MHVFKVDKKPLYSIEFAPDGQSVLTAVEQRVHRWSVPDGEQIRQWPAPKHGGLAWFSPDGRHLAIGGQQFTLRTIGGKNVVKERRYTQSVAFTPNGEELFAAGHEGVLRRWCVEDGAELPCEWQGARDGSHPDGLVACHPSEDVVAATFGEASVAGGRGQSSIEFFDVRSGESVAQIRVPERFTYLTRLQYGRGGELIAAICGPLWRSWSTRNGELLAEEDCGPRHLQDLVFSPDGERLLTVGNDARIRVWNTGDWSEMTGFEWDIGPLTCVAVSPDGTLYAAGSKKGKVVLWDDWP